MNMPTEAEVRAEPAGRRLDAWVEAYVFEYGPLMRECGDWGWKGLQGQFVMPKKYAVDPATSAELERFLWASGEFAEIETRIIHGFAMVTLEPPTGDNWFANHPFDADPVAARMLCLAKAAVLWKIGGGT